MLICQQPHFNNQWMGQKNIDLLTVKQLCNVSLFRPLFNKVYNDCLSQ
jgi:hypothetical protein